MNQGTPHRSKSSLGNYPSAMATPSSKGRMSMTDFRRPPSSRSLRSSSPRLMNRNSSSRPGSSIGSFSGSRPSTPSSLKPHEPYTGSITVSIRPNPQSVTAESEVQWGIDENRKSIHNTVNDADYQFDNVFPASETVTNREVYGKTCSSIVESFFNEGFNGTVFAYGMTGSGKTYSMKGTSDDPGFVELAIDDIYSQINNSGPKKHYNITLSYLEIYNEKIIDLLNPLNSTDLKIRDDPEYGTRIIGITSSKVDSKDQLLQLIKKGDVNRKTSATDFNSRSSRSHSVLQIKLDTTDLEKGTEQHSTLSLCDLAGSERATSSVERRKEGAYINKSLLALSNVINKLSMSSNSNYMNPSEHIPYRDSKLTRLLQPALSGSSLVSILCTIHLGSGSSGNSNGNQYVSETFNTLRFAARAKDIVMNVQRNQETGLSSADSAKLISELQRTIESQNSELRMLKARDFGNSHSSSFLRNSSIPSSEYLQLEAENKILNEKVEHLTRLTDIQKTETIILKNATLNDIIGSGMANNASQKMMSNLEEFYKRVTYEMEEYQSYIGHLENKLKNVYETQSERREGSDGSSYTNKQRDSLLNDQEEEIMSLREQLKDKDHIIKSLSKTTKLRRLVDSTSNNKSIESILKKSIVKTEMIEGSSDKENFDDSKQFNARPGMNNQ